MASIIILFLLAMNVIVGIALGQLVVPILTAMTGNHQLSVCVVMMLWIMSIPLTLCYGGLLPGVNESLKHPRSQRAEGKLSTASLRFAVVYAAIGGGCLQKGGLSDAWVWPIALCLGVVGYLIGRDYRARVENLRRERKAEEHSLT